MAGLTEFQKSRCPNNLTHESWKECSSCPNGRVSENEFAGRSANCTLSPTIPTVFTVIGRNKKSILDVLPEIEGEIKHGFRRGHIGDVYWNLDGKVPSHFKHNYDEE